MDLETLETETAAAHRDRCRRNLPVALRLSGWLSATPVFLLLNAGHTIESMWNREHAVRFKGGLTRSRNGSRQRQPHPVAERVLVQDLIGEAGHGDPCYRDDTRIQPDFGDPQGS